MFLNKHIDALRISPTCRHSVKAIVCKLWPCQFNDGTGCYLLAKTAQYALEITMSLIPLRDMTYVSINQKSPSLKCQKVIHFTFDLLTEDSAAISYYTRSIIQKTGSSSQKLSLLFFTRNLINISLWNLVLIWLTAKKTRFIPELTDREKNRNCFFF